MQQRADAVNGRKTVAAMTASPPALAESVARLRRSNPDARILGFDHDGHRYWLKQAIDEGWRKRLSKGGAAAALDREVEKLRRLAREGVAVPPIADAGVGYVVLADCGPTLDDMVRAPHPDPAQVATAFAEAGRALAALHARGLTHGRAKIKDLCWDGAQIRFIDFEDRPGPADPSQARLHDLTTFVLHGFFVAIRTGQDLTPALDAFIAAYRAGGGAPTCRQAVGWARRRWWLRPLAWPIARLSGPRRAPDFKAVTPALDYLLTLDDAAA